MRYILQRNIKPTLKYHPNWYYPELLEKCHIFLDNENSVYRKIIRNIANNIIANNIKYTTVKLYNDDDTIFNSYEIINPFQNISHLNIISKLKIFLSTNENKAPYIIASKLSKELEKEYNPDVLPLFQSDGTTIQVISIIVESTDLNNLYDILTHEIRHGLDYIKDSKLTQRTNNANYPYDILKDKAISNTNKKYKALYDLAADCTYYTQDTEIKAHLENAYNELIDYI